MEYRSFLEKTLTQASQMAKEFQGRVSVTLKPGDNNQVLTEADLAIGEFIVGECQNQYPDYNIIDEEAGVIDKGSNYTWVIDPIDGTSNFASGLPHYGIIIGLLDGETPITGAVALPYFDKLYVAERSKGTFLNGEKIVTKGQDKLSDSLLAYGIDGYQDEPQRTHDEIAMLGSLILSVRNLRSSNSVFDIMSVVDGSYGASLNQTSKIWDNVGCQVIVEEAGGKYTDFWGRQIDNSNPLKKAEDNFTMCAASTVLHGQVQSVIHQ